LRLGSLDACDATLNEALALRPDDAAAIWMKGVLALRRGDNPAALFRRAAQTPNAPADVLGNFGLYLLSEEQPAEAETYLRQAATGQTGNGRVYAELGKIALEQNRIDEAYRLLKRATQLSPRNVEAWAVLAEVQKNRNEPAQAVASLHQALQAAGGAQRGMVLMELGRAKMAGRGWSEAAELFAQAADYPAVRPRAAFLAAQCYYFTEAYGKAMFYIDQAIATAPNDSVVNEWKRKIENARYGPTTESAKPTPFLLDVPSKARTKETAKKK
jgi:Tfp pilus assembly protein PilF